MPSASAFSDYKSAIADESEIRVIVEENRYMAPPSQEAIIEGSNGSTIHLAEPTQLDVANEGGY